MMKYTLLLALVSCTLLVSVNASWIDVKDRLKDRVIHVESLLKRGRWLWQNDNTDNDGSRYLWLDELAERDTYYTPRVQFQTTECGDNKYLCLEPLSLRDFYLAAGFPAGGKDHTVKLQHTTYPEGDNRFYWKILCESYSLEKCKLVPIRFEGDGLLMVTHGKGSGHYDAMLGPDDGNNAYFRVHAPNPTDDLIEIYENTNRGSVDQLAKYTTMVGVSQKHETSSSITVSVSTEIGGAFKAVTASVSSSVSNTWAITDSTTYESAKTVEHDIVIPARSRVVLYQLQGNYAGEFGVGADAYEIHEYKIDNSLAAPSKQEVNYSKGTRDEEQLSIRDLIRRILNL